MYLHIYIYVYVHTLKVALLRDETGDGVLKPSGQQSPSNGQAFPLSSVSTIVLAHF